MVLCSSYIDCFGKTPFPKQLTEEFIKGLQFRGWVHDHHDGEHDNKQEGMC